MADERVDVKFGADTGNLQAGTEAAATTVDSATSRMGADFQRMQTQTAAAVNGMKAQVQASFAQMKTAMSTITGVMAGVGLAMAGGAAFKEVIGSTNAWAGEAIKLSKALAITTTEASVLNLALGDTYNSMDTMLTGASMLTKTLKTNEGALKTLGVETRDNNGNYRNTLEIMTEVNEALKSTKEGTDRNVAGMTIYGRGWREVQGLLRLNKEAMEEARKKAEELHLLVGPEGVQQTRAYKAAMNDIEDVLASVKIQIGNAVMPALIQLGSWFGSAGPGFIEMFSGALKGLVTFFMSAALGLEIGFRTIKAALEILVNYALAAYKAIGQAATGDFSGAAATMGRAWREGGETTASAFDKITDSATKTGSALGKLWGLSPVRQSKLGPDGPDGKRYAGNTKAGGAGGSGGAGSAEKSRMAEWENYLEQKKLKEKDYFKDSREADLAYWESRKSAGNLTQDELFSIERKIFEIKRTLAQEGIQAQLQNMRQESDAALSGSQERIEIARREATLIKSTYGDKSKEYAASLREIDKMQREHDADTAKRATMVIEKQRELDQLSIEDERQTLTTKRSMGLISADQEIEAEKQLEQRKYIIDVAAQKEVIAAQRTGSLEHLKENQKLEVMEAQHAKKMASYNIKAAHDVAAGWGKAFESMSKLLEEGFNAMHKGTLKFSHVWKTLTNTMLSSYGKMLKKIVVRHLSAMMAKATATKTGVALENAAEEEGALKSMAINMMMTMKRINNAAVAAAAGAYDAMASIPYVGPVLGAVAAAVVYAGVMAFGAMASASGGYDIPAGTNPVTQLHSEEMVLPADLANSVRAMTGKGGGSGGGTGGGGGDMHVHLNVSTLDAKGVKSFMKANKAAVASAAIAHVRNLGSFSLVKGAR